MTTQPLLAVISEWTGHAQKLLGLLDRQSKACAERDVATVEGIQPEMEAELERLSGLDARRVAIVKQLAEDLGCAESMRAISAELPNGESRTLTALCERAGQLAERIRYAMERNKALLENELVYVRGTLGLIAQAAQEATPYSHGSAPAIWVDEVA